MFGQVSAGLVAVFVMGYAYYRCAMKPPSPKKFTSELHASLLARGVKLSDGRCLAYRERGVTKEIAKHKVVVSHAFADSKDFEFPVSQDLLDQLGIYLLSYDRAGYGESDPNPTRSIKSEAFDIQELADALQLGPKFYVLGISLGTYAVYACLKYIPHRLLGAALIVPLANYWWRCFPSNISEKAFHILPTQDKWTFRVAHHAPWLLYWWITQKWFPSLSALEGKTDALSLSDIEILKQIVDAQEHDLQREVDNKDQSVHESLVRDLMVGFGKWEFEPTDIVDPFPNKEGCVHIWQGYEDKVFPKELNRHISQLLPWIQYHEITNTGHLLIYNRSYCDAIFRTLVSP